MINEYVNKLIDNLPLEFKNLEEPLIVDLVLDGGVFNGSYLIGALYFLKEMEKRNYIKVDRISGCSIGSVVGFLYFIDSLDLMIKLYDTFNNSFRKNYSLEIIKDLKGLLNDKIPKDICKTVNNRLFICYNNIKLGSKKVKSIYKDTDEIINTIIRSCFIPYLIDGNICYENKHIDGINPYIFALEPGKKILYLDLFGYDKIGNLLNVKNEKTNFHRVLSGLLDIHTFFIKQSTTQMCSFVNDWNINNRIFNYIKLLFEKICMFLIYTLIYVKKIIPVEFEDTVIYKIFTKILKESFIIILESYCL
uniref:PNPLA domain-containing protein n=1 Tax=viral metagenome TaxID=1070528 RepID=A0A6C0ERD6_9ZZZZ